MKVISFNLANWLMSLSETAENCVRVYAELGRACSAMIRLTVLDIAIRDDVPEIIDDETRELIVKFFAYYDKVREGFTYDDYVAEVAA